MTIIKIKENNNIVEYDTDNINIVKWLYDLYRNMLIMQGTEISDASWDGISNNDWSILIYSNISILCYL